MINYLQLEANHVRLEDRYPKLKLAVIWHKVKYSRLSSSCVMGMIAIKKAWQKIQKLLSLSFNFVPRSKDVMVESISTVRFLNLEFFQDRKKRTDRSSKLPSISLRLGIIFHFSSRTCDNWYFYLWSLPSDSPLFGSFSYPIIDTTGHRMVYRSQNHEKHAGYTWHPQNH